MKCLRVMVLAGMAALCWIGTVPQVRAEETRAKESGRPDRAAVYPVAVLKFHERGRDSSELGGKVTDLLFVNLVTRPELFLVDRDDIDRLFAEQELNQSGLINPEEATRVGALTGAKILVTGSVLLIDDRQFLVAKIIGTETGRVLGASARGAADDSLDGLVDSLADAVAMVITERSQELIPAPVEREDRMAALAKSLGKGKRPTLWIDIPERHVGQVTSDPAAETELTMICRELGFEVIDHQQGARSDADVIVSGEGLSQFASRHGNLVSVKARVELKAVDRETGRVIAVDRQVSVAVDLAEQVAAKSALSDAAGTLAARLLPRLTARK